jgi:acetaldehyde dehydrogenase
MVTCGGQATVPMVAAVSRVTPVSYGEIVASVSSRSAGPGTRANIDEFTRSTALAVEVVGGAASGKAIIILNPADPPSLMRDTIFCGIEPDADFDSIVESIESMVADVARFVPGYRRAAPLSSTSRGPTGTGGLGSPCCSRWKAPATAFHRTRGISI